MKQAIGILFMIQSLYFTKSLTQIHKSLNQDVPTKIARDTYITWCNSVKVYLLTNVTYMMAACMHSMNLQVKHLTYVLTKISTEMIIMLLHNANSFFIEIVNIESTAYKIMMKNQAKK